MSRPNLRQPGRFLWHRIGNSFVARFGKFQVSVSKRGRSGVNLVWRVRDVFWNSWLGQGDHESIDDAILEAEAIALLEERSLHRAITGLDAGSP